MILELVLVISLTAIAAIGAAWKPWQQKKWIEAVLNFVAGGLFVGGLGAFALFLFI